MRNKNRKNTCQRKQLHAQDNIYVVQQFAYVHGVAGISLLSGKKYKVRLQFFHTLSQDDNHNHKTLITKKRYLHPAHKIHNGLQNRPKNFGLESD